jgi:adenine deaminase
MDLTNLISVARGEKEADLILKNGRIVNTFVGKIIEDDIAIYKDKIAGVGNYTNAKEIIDLKGDFIAPALMNGHVHIESSMLHPFYYAKALVPKGVLSVFTDLHEITNVSGLEGIKFVMYWAEKLPMDIFFMTPSCVPASDKETSGFNLTLKEIKEVLNYPEIIGLGEMMNFNGIINGDEEELEKIILAKGKVIDGHAPNLRGKQLNAYLSSGILSDHETTEYEEGKEKLEKGMFLMIREGSTEKNLETLLPLVNDKTYRRCIFITDDKSCFDLLKEGDIDDVVRKAIEFGLDPIRAIQMASINTAEYFHLFQKGGIGPGYSADLMSLSNLEKLEVDKVFYQGKLVAKQGKSLFSIPKIPLELNNTINFKPFNKNDLKLKAKTNQEKEKRIVIEIIPGQIKTRKMIEKMDIKDEKVVPNIKKDILKLVVIERHKATGNIGIGLVKGFGLTEGAFASTHAHDSHNIVCVGTNDDDIIAAIKEIKKLQGGFVVCEGGEIKAKVSLPIAGLLSNKPLKKVVSEYKDLLREVEKLGDLPPAPFDILSFLTLAVIPEVRLTDLGLVDLTAN